MGYNTSYSFSVIDQGKEPDNLLELLRNECEDAQYAIDDEGNALESARWYDHEEEVKAFSGKYPTALMELSGYGDEQEDMWKEYYKGGKVQRCNAIITFAPFSETELK